MALYSIISFLRKLNKLKRDKQQGIKDFISEEYIDYLSSSESELKYVPNLEIKYKKNMDFFELKGDLYFNNAGIFIKLHNPFKKGDLHDSFFVFGREKPSKFLPRSQSYFVSAELYESTLLLILQTEKGDNHSNYKIEMMDVSHSVYSELIEILKLD